MLNKPYLPWISKWLIVFLVSAMLHVLPGPMQAKADAKNVTFTVTSEVYGIEHIRHAKVILYDEWNLGMHISSWDDERQVHRVNIIYQDTDSYKMLVLAPDFKAYQAEGFELPDSEDPIQIDLDEKTEDYVYFEDENFQQFIGEQLYTDYSTDIPITKDAMKYVQNVDIYHCGGWASFFECDGKISSIEGIQYANHLRSIQIDNQEITSIGPLAQMENLTNVQMENNRIESLEPLTTLPNLTSIYMANNNISGALPSFMNEHQLKYLDVSQNQITDISAIANLPSIIKLDVHHNQLTSLPVFQMPALERLDLSYNFISDIDPLWSSELDKLDALFLGSNFISDFYGLDKFTALDTLDVSYNLISDLGFLEEMANDRPDFRMWHLDLSGNAISDFSALLNLNRIYGLNLQDMDLSSDQAEDGLYQLVDVMEEEDYVHVYGSYFDEESFPAIRSHLTQAGIQVKHSEAYEDVEMAIIQDPTIDWQAGKMGTLSLHMKPSEEVYPGDAYIQYVRVLKDGKPLREDEVVVHSEACESLPEYRFYGKYCIGPVITYDTPGISLKDELRTDVDLVFIEPGTYIIAYDLVFISSYSYDFESATQFMTLHVEEARENSGVYVDTNPEAGKLSGYVFAELYDVPPHLDNSQYFMNYLNEDGDVIRAVDGLHHSATVQGGIVLPIITDAYPADTKYIGIYAKSMEDEEQYLLLKIELHDAMSMEEIQLSIRYSLFRASQQVEVSQVLPMLAQDLTGEGEVTHVDIALWLSAIDSILNKD